MPQIDLIKHETEQKLQDALNTMLDFLSLNHSPKDALVKAAKVHKLSKDQIRVVARAYNTGLVLNQLKQDDIQKRASVPNLVDPEAAIKELFVNPFKETKISSDYLYEPKFVESKQASLHEEFHKDAFIRRAVRQAKQAQDDYEDEFIVLKRQYKDLSEKRRQAILRLEKVANELIDYFRSKNPIKPEEIIKNASITYGPLTKKVFEIIKSDIPNNEFVEFQPINWEKPPYSLIKSAISEIKEIVKLDKELAKIPEDVKKRPVEKVAILASTKDSVIDQMRWDSCLAELQIKKKAAADAGTFGEKLITMTIPTRAYESVKEVSEFLPKPTPIDVDLLANVSKQYKLNKKKIAVYLSSLAKDDAIISRYSLDDIIDAYNYLSRFAPISMQSPITIKMLLRKVLESGGVLDEYTLSQLATMESRLRQSLEYTTNQLVRQTQKPQIEVVT